jgi:ADP-heptose:LPS heptosyltransferase
VTEVLVLRALGLGDLLASVPALRGVRRAWPGARVTLAAPEVLGRWLRDLGLVDDVAEVPGLDAGVPLGGRRPPDVAVGLHGRGPQSHRALAALRPGRLVAYACPEANHHDGPRWQDDEHEVDRWVRLLRTVGATASPHDLRLPPPGPRGDHVVVHPGAASASRRWPADRWAAVARSLAATGVPVVVTGSAGEAALGAQVSSGVPGALDRCGRDDLPGLARVVGTAALLLSGDTGVAHLGTALGTPSVTLFGPVSPALWGPRVDEHLHRALWRGEARRPRPGDPHGTTLDPLLEQLTVPEVLDAARAVLRLPAAARQPRVAPAIVPSSPSTTGPCEPSRS